MDNDQNILDASFTETKNKKRKDLLPWWIKVFSWLFLIAGIVAPLGFIVGAFGVHFDISLFGLETNSPLSLVGIVLLIAFMLNGVAAWGLLKEQKWAISIGQIAAVVGIGISVFTMFISPFLDSRPGFHLTFRLELLLLIPFLLKLGSIKDEWEREPS